MRRWMVCLGTLVLAVTLVAPGGLVSAQDEGCAPLAGVWGSDSEGIGGIFTTYLFLYPDCRAMVFPFEGGYEGTLTPDGPSRLRFDGLLHGDGEPQAIGFDVAYDAAGDALLAEAGRGDMAAPFRRVQPITPEVVEACPDAPPARMVAGFWGFVATGDGMPVNLRREPARSADRTAVADGTAFVVIGGPACGDGFTWWQVRLADDGQIGWMAEGDADRYYLAPSGRRDAAEVAPPDGIPADGPLLQPEERIQIGVSPGLPPASFRFSAAAGQVGVLRLAFNLDTDLNVTTTVYAPGGQVVPMASAGAVRNGMVQAYDLPETGDYTIVFAYDTAAPAASGYAELLASMTAYFP